MLTLTPDSARKILDCRDLKLQLHEMQKKHFGVKNDLQEVFFQTSLIEAKIDAYILMMGQPAPVTPEAFFPEAFFKAFGEALDAQAAASRRSLEILTETIKNRPIT